MTEITVRRIPWPRLMWLRFLHARGMSILHNRIPGPLRIKWRVNRHFETDRICTIQLVIGSHYWIIRRGLKA